MVDLKVLKSRGCSSGAYKKIFSKPVAEMTPRQRSLVNLLSQRARDGFVQSLRDYKVFQAIDIAYEVEYDQTTPTLVRHILSNHLNPQETVKALKDYGLSDDTLLLDVPNPARPDQMVKMVNPPVFFQIFIPIVKAYVEAMIATIFNERNTNPLFRYKPLRDTHRDQVLCEIVTDVIDTQSTDLGYAAVLRQAIQQMLKYGIMIALPREEWYCEEQIIDTDGIEEVTTIKEGLRYFMPHPTRMWYDLQYPLTSINTDTGCQFIGHWHILKYGDILDNRMYWNKKAIFGGTNWFQAPGVGNYFQEVYPCNLKFPEQALWMANTGLREDKASYYNTTSDRDKAVFVSHHFMKLIPDEFDLSNKTEGGKGYPYPVWHRIITAGDDTVVWMEPCAYNPAWFMGYDYDEMSARSPTFALELIPWQDQLGNVLSQMVLTAKQNLLNVTFYNNQVVDRMDILKMIDAGEGKYRGMQFIGYDGLKMQAARIDMHDVFNTVNIAKVNIQDLAQLIPTFLNMMERVLGISAQATGAAASHQQSKKEVETTSVSSSNRTAKIASSVDDGTDAWMRQMHAGHQAHADGEVEAEVSKDIPDVKEHIEELGFKIKGNGDGSHLVTGHKRQLRLAEFASRNMGPQAQRDKEIAQTIFQVIGTISGQEDLRQKIGAQNLLSLIEEAAKLAGAPRDFRLRIDPDAKDDQVPKAVQEAIAQAGQAMLQGIEEKIAKPIAGEMAQDKAKLDQLEATVKQLEGIYKIAAAANDKQKVREAETQQKMSHRQQAFDAEQQRKDKAAQSEMRRKDAATIQQLQEANALLQQKLEAMQKELNAKIQAEQHKTAASITMDKAKTDAAIAAKKKEPAKKSE